MDNTNQTLIDAARQARGLARAKYSNFKVGSALLCGDGRVFTGCNIESSSYGLTICSERVALFKALSEGGDTFIRIVVVADTDELTAPCGACRQLLWDFCGDLEIVLTNLTGKSKTLRLTQLFPEPFGDHLFGLPVRSNCRDAENQVTFHNSSTVDVDLRTRLMLSIQRALLGEVTSNLLSLTCGLQNNKITIRAYFDGPVSSADRERIDSVGGEVIADFAEDFTIEETCSSIQDEEPEVLDFWAFMRISSSGRQTV